MNNNGRDSRMAMLILGTLFFVFGFVTWLNGTLIPYLKIACELNNFQSLLVAFAFYISYFVMALPSSRILEKTGFKKGMMLGLCLMAAGALVFIPAALTRTYGLFLTGLFIIGSGLSVLQTASNPYITIVGPLESAARRISIMGICNKVAGVMAPIILGAVILADADKLTQSLLSMDAAEKVIKLNELASRVIIPYSSMAVILIVLAAMIQFSPLPEIESELMNDQSQAEKGTSTSIGQFPNLVLGVIALFLYVGAEVLAADTIGSFGQSQGIALSEAKIFTSYTLTAMVIGYVAGIFLIPNYINQSNALCISAILGLILSLLALFTHGYLAVLFVALLGIANALMWPAIWPLSLEGLGKHTKTASALLIMAIAGGAMLPLVYGWLADFEFIGQHKAYVILLPAYAFILFYSIKGHRMRGWHVSE